MTIIKAKYAKQDDIPEQYRELFEERGEEWLLKKDAIEGVKTEADVQRVQRALETANSNYKAAKAKLDKLGDKDVDELLKTVDEVEELRARIEAAGDNGKNEELIQKRIDAAVKAQTGPLERRLQQAEKDRDTALSNATAATTELNRTKVEVEIQRIATGKIQPTAMEDLVERGVRVFEFKEGKVVAKDTSDMPGITPDAWLPGVLEKYPHYAPLNVGAGAGGSNGGNAPASNPFTKAGWNRTSQFALPAEKRESMAKAAGFQSFDAAVAAGKPIEK